MGRLPGILWAGLYMWLGRHGLMLLAAAAWALTLPTLARAQSYSPMSEPYAWVSTAGHANVTWDLGSCAGGGAPVDDDITPELPLGFTFRYGGVDYTTVRVMSNGRLQFSNTFCYSGTASTGPPPTYSLALPDGNMARVMRIYGADLDSTPGGTVTYATRGAAPNRSFVVTWTNVQEWGESTSSFNLQVVLYENGDFVYQYGSISNPSGGNAQIGWELTTSDYGLYSVSNIEALANTALRWTGPRGAINGTVFEDVNYGGGAGRGRATALSAGGSGRPGARVELYRVTGSDSNFVAAATTDGSGNYSFPALSGGTYQVRVVNSTVASSRSGYVGTLLPVLTYRTDGSSMAGTVNAVTDRVGGETPNLADAASNGSATLESLTTASTTAQSVAAVQVASAAVDGVDFGFNFDTIVNTNDSGDGSLRQAITNANLLTGDGTLAQAGRTPAVENLIFMISNGTAAAGLRSANNDFIGGVATLSPGSALPSVTAPLIIDGQNQPGFGASPIIELNGSLAGPSADGLLLGAGATGSTVRGLIINRFSRHGIQLQSGGNTVQACWIGTSSAGNVASANAQNGIYASSTGNTIGGSGGGSGNLISGNGLNGVQFDAGGNTVRGNTIGLNLAGTAALGNTNHGIYLSGGDSQVIGGTSALQRNVVSGNGFGGIFVGSGSGHLIQGNYVGTSLDGGAAVGNLAYFGVEIHGGGSNQVGGTSAGTANVISGQSGAGKGGINLASNGNTVQGNLIGTNAAGTAGLANAGPGIAVAISSVSNNTIGGTATGAGNVIAYNGAAGVQVSGASATGNRISRNSIYASGGIGIDIATAGRDANNGTKNASLGNAEMDTPLIATGTLDAGNLTVSGYVGSAAGQSVFANATLEFFKAANDGSGYGQGQTYLGTLTADASGNFSGSFAVSGLGVGDLITATAIDASGNTSEFSANFTVLAPYAISGTVFEDVNYGGGAGRSMAASGGSGLPGVQVELYNSNAAFVTSTTTAAGGGYSFIGLTSGSYFVRVVNGTVASARNGSGASLAPVMTYRTEANAGTANAVNNEVGGTNPAKVDAIAGSGGTTLWTICGGENGSCSFSGTRTVRYGANGASASGWATLVLTGGTACSNGVFGDPLPGTVKNCYLLNADYQSVATARIASSVVSGVDFGFNFDTVVNTNDSAQGSLRQAIINANTLTGDAGLAQNGRPAAIETVLFMISNGTAAAGLRSTNNYFVGGVASIAPASALPDASTPMSINAQTQPGWTAAPIVELNGAGAGAGVSGLTARGGAAVRGLIINRYSANGVQFLDTGGNTLAGCYIGTNAAGTAASANGGIGLNVFNSPANTIGGTAAGAANLISGNTSHGVSVTGTSSAQTLQGNTIGLNAAGSARLANGAMGVLLDASGATIGGTSAAARNVIAGNTSENLQIGSSAGATVVQGNYFGTTASGTAGPTNGGDNIVVTSAGNQIGGTAANAGNVIAGAAGHGLKISGDVTGNAVLGNSVFGNGGIGIDLAADGPSANDGVKTTGQPNLLMDYPVFTTASLASTTLTLTGYVGGAAGQSTFANVRVEVFISDASNTNGQGRTYLGFLTTDASGNFSGNITGVAGVTNGTTKITGTATDTANNSSEFGPNAIVGVGLSGTVFEDVNYGGGSGRSLVASGGVGLSGAVVELYDSTGAYLSNTTTIAGGTYTFTGLSSGNYLVRVVSSSVLSQRSGSVASLRGVMTFRTNASSGTAVAVTDHVGGTSPAVADSGAGTNGTTLNTTSYAFTAGLSGTAHAIAPVTVSTAAVGDMDFGFNFDTVVNTNDSGQGSLRQAITNANTLAGDGGLAQSGRTAALENLVFMLPNGTAGGGMRSAVATVFTTGGGSASVATISPATGLPAISAALVLDAQTQPGWTTRPLVEINGVSAGSTDGLHVTAAGTVVRGFIINRFANGGIAVEDSSTVQGNWLGTTASGSAASANATQGLKLDGNASTVGGTSASQGNVLSGNAGAGLWLSSGSGHVVQGNLIGVGADGTTAVANTGLNGIEVYASNSTIGGPATGAGNVISGQSNASKGGISVCSSGNTVQGNRIGTNAAGTAALANAGKGITVCVDSTGNLIGGLAIGAGNVISGNGGDGVADFGTGTVFQGNTIGLSATGTAALPNGSSGLNLLGGGTLVGGAAAGAGNVISGNSGDGVNVSGTSVTIQGNTIGLNTARSAALANGASGIILAGAGATVGGTAVGAGNTISGNAGKGVVVQSGTGHAILGNVVYGNGGIAIDLGANGVTANDGAKTNGQPNLLMDSPVFVSGRATGNQLVVAGYVGSAAGQSTFAGSRVEVFTSDDAAGGYGGGKTYLGALTADASGNFSGTLTMPVSGLALGSKLSGTATDGSSNTSEFGANFAALVVDLVVNDNGDAVDSSVGDGTCMTAGGACTLRAAIAELNAWPPLSATPSIVFAIPGCSVYGSAGCRITPATALPSITRSVLIDATTQAGFNPGSYAPIIEINGSAAPASTTGLVVSANNSTLRGLVVNGFPGNGVTLSGSGNTLVGMRIGLTADSASASANGGAGAYISGPGSIVGGVPAADRNVIAGNTGPGLLVAAGNSTIRYNYLGTDSAANAGLGNGGAGVFVQSAGLSGIAVSGNTIANNGSSGVAIAAGGPAQVRILGNAMSGNGGLGIDLGNDGLTANTGSTDSTKPNNNINQPVITGAGIGSGSMTIYGYVGTGSGQAVFAGAQVDFFKAAPDPTGYGEGQVYLGFLIADADGRFSGTFTIGGLANIGDPITATATDGVGNTSEFGPNWTSTTVAALTPGKFNAFDTDAASNAISGVIRSRTAGTATSLAIVALDNAGTALHPGFTGTVNLNWVDARNDGGAVTGSCRASWIDLGSAGTAVFNNSSRVAVTVTPPANGTRIMRLKISYTSNGITTSACSNDAFADLPASLTWVNASDADSSTAGITRVLNNSGSSGGTVHRAGRPFTVRAQALDATGALMTGYDGSPVLATAGCLLPAGCSAAALAAADTAAIAGNYTHVNVSYDEVGAIQLQLTDANYGAIDTVDTIIGVRTLTSALMVVGRFIPDSLALSISTNGQLATANGACMANGSGATFIGQGFSWNTAPQVTITAKNAAGATTTRWTGSLMKLVSSMASETLSATATGSATLSASYGTPSVQDLGSGQARVTASATDRFVLDIAAGAVQDSVTPTWLWNIDVADSSEAATGGNPTLSATAGQGSVAFNSGAIFHSGRLSLSPGYGDVRTGVKLLAQMQRYTAAGWVTLTEDQGCVTIQTQNVGVEAPSGVFSSIGVCAAPIQGAVTTKGGRAWLSLPATPGGAPGRLTLRLAGQSAAGNSCTSAGASAALVPLALPWLTGGTSGAGPQAWATWGTPQRDALLRRETW